MTRGIRIASVATLASQILIVGTGGAVRLTGSGLGCTTWPSCEPGSFTPVPEQGIHGIIEFANRVMGGAVLLIALVMLVLAIVHRRRHPGVLPLAIVVVLGTIAQALIGAVVVFLHLRPDTVGIHFALSAVLVGVAAWMAWRVFRGRRARFGGTLAQRALMLGTAVMVPVVVVVGILTTGSGPHAGDGGTARNGLDPEVMQHVHALPAYALLALAVGLLLVGWRLRPFGIWAGTLLALLVTQATIGIVQSNLGLPIALVGAHMVLSVMIVATTVLAALSLRVPAAQGVEVDDVREPVAA
ncbi:COX15/CtaA family protein [Agrococcus sp. SGAir0287]|uniref:COX15/CtaA family protein n=1 Tax=Agrococcus sp. SGAir0287 TaxID=2070347 RepID=UPI001585FBA4|nr:COX15/CtaA family protein [Agrococcus sp. SGAir0287]